MPLKDKLEQLGIGPITELLKEFNGGWPVLNKDWKEVTIQCLFKLLNVYP